MEVYFFQPVCFASSLSVSSVLNFQAGVDGGGISPRDRIPNGVVGILVPVDLIGKSEVKPAVVT